MSAYPYAEIPQSSVKYHWKLNKLASELLSPCYLQRLKQLFLLYNSSALEENQPCIYLPSLLQLFMDAKILCPSTGAHKASVLTTTYLEYAFAAAAFGSLKMYYDCEEVPALFFPAFCGLLLHCSKALYPQLPDCRALAALCDRFFESFQMHEREVPSHLTSCQPFTIHDKAYTELWVASLNEYKASLLQYDGNEYLERDIDRTTESKFNLADVFTDDEIQLLRKRFQLFDNAVTGMLHRLEVIAFFSGVLSSLNIDNGKLEELYEKVVSRIKLDCRSSPLDDAQETMGNYVTFDDLMMALMEVRYPSKVFRIRSNTFVKTTTKNECAANGLPQLPPLHYKYEALESEIMENAERNIGVGSSDHFTSNHSNLSCVDSAELEKFTGFADSQSLASDSMHGVDTYVAKTDIHMTNTSAAASKVCDKTSTSKAVVANPAAGKRTTRQINIELVKGKANAGKLSFIEIAILPQATQFFQTHGCYVRKCSLDALETHARTDFLSVHPKEWIRCEFHTVCGSKKTTLTALLHAVENTITSCRRGGFDYRTPEERSGFRNQLLNLKKSASCGPSKANGQHVKKPTRLKKELENEPDDCIVSQTSLQSKPRRQRKYNTKRLEHLAMRSIKTPAKRLEDSRLISASQSSFLADYSWIVELTRPSSLSSASQRHRPRSSAL